MEELGLEAGTPHLIGIYPFAKMNQVILAYHVQTSGPITLGDELVDVKLVEPARVRRVARRHRVGAARLAARPRARAGDERPAGVDSPPMKAVWFERKGPAREVLVHGDMPAPEPGVGEVRVRLQVSGVNPTDTKTRGGWLGNDGHGRSRG